MPLHEREKLSDLVGLRLTTDLLQVQQLRYPRVREDVMAATGPCQAEPETMHEIYHIGERDVARPVDDPPRLDDAATRVVVRKGCRAYRTVGLGTPSSV